MKTFNIICHRSPPKTMLLAAAVLLATETITHTGTLVAADVTLVAANWTGYWGFRVFENP
ncbi:hypothetical protein BVRB_2g033960 [Beta vulgaris subsp. vulgaris]|nr:hypothetical protein BVRB_2g033960 [Beta vulgaris subsp. vulgaris]